MAINLNIPRVISASSAKKLQEEIVSLTARTGQEYKFISIYSQGQKHYAWFYATTKLDFKPGKGSK